MAIRSCRILSALLVLWGVVAGATAAPAAGTKHFFWKVTGGKGTVYLLGTIHVGKAGFYPLPSIIEDDFKRSDTLIEELDLSAVDAAQPLSQTVIQQGTYRAGDSITNHISKKTQGLLEDYAKIHHLGPNYIRLKPWLLDLLIDGIEAKRLGLNAVEGMDKHFVQEASQTHKPIGALETADFQIKMLMSFSDQLQDQQLMTTLLETVKGTEILDHILRAWTSGDPQEMETVITQVVREYPALSPVIDKVIYERNDTMTQKIIGFLETNKVYFVAIGAAHLVGERGILSQLSGKGYTVEQQ